MSNIVPYLFESATIRTVTDEHGDPWFVLRDVLAAGLESSTTTAQAQPAILEGLGGGQINVIPIVDSMGRTQQATIVSEAAVTYLLSRSNTDAGKRMNRWLHTEVLPQIRKTGSYHAPGARRDIYPAPAREFTSLFKVGRLLGLDRNAAAISANQAVTTATGVNLLLALGQTHLKAETQALYFTPTELGERLGLSGRKFNLLLADVGLQAREGEYWVPSAAAGDFCRIYDTGKKHGSGVPVTQVKWADAVLGLVKPEQLA